MDTHIRIKTLIILTFFIFAAACAPTRPLPQPKRVVDPGTVQGSLQTENWDIAPLRYDYPGEGLNYQKADLEPVFLVFKNTSQMTPRVLIDEVTGIGKDGEYLPYTVDEAARLVFDSETFRITAKNAAKSGGFGAAVGAGLGFVFALIGGDNPLAGAGAGAAIGGISGAALSVPEAERQLKQVVNKELRSYAWKEDPIPPDRTRMGYIYLPGNKGIDRVKITVRSELGIKTYELELLDPEQARGMAEGEETAP